jgi:hypothetical protein
MERVRMFELLIANRGSLTTPEIVDFLNTTAPTARRTMTELKATGLVSMEIGEGQTPSKITLKPDFDWFLHVQFRLLKEKYPPQKEVSIPLSLPVLLYDHLITRNVVRVEVAAKNPKIPLIIHMRVLSVGGKILSAKWLPYRTVTVLVIINHSFVGIAA